MSVSIEDYMKTLYSLYEDSSSPENKIKSGDIALRLNISKASVSQMLSKLTRQGLVKREPYSKILLTKKGLLEAKKITHNHRVIEVFLNKVLDYRIADVHEEAHRLEHSFSSESIRRLNMYLKKPKKSPSGKPIPFNNK